jgi:GT2 family glycosyltransferase
MTPSAPQPPAAPASVSVIVPVYAQWHLVPALLAALQRQRRPAEEIILINNGAPADADGIHLPANARLLHCPTPGAYAARNQGVEHANGTWLAFTDADCLPEPGWLEQLLAAAAAEQAGAQPCLLAGRIRMDASAPPRNWCEAYEQVHGIPQAHYVRRGYATTANLLVPRALFARVGRFDAQRLSGGDAEFCRRARRQGAALHYVASAEVRHRLRSDWRQLCLKARRLKGGQLAAGRPSRRLLWFLRAWLPPLHLYRRYLRAREHPRAQRWIAVYVQSGLWLVGLVEAMRVYLFKRPGERR